MLGILAAVVVLHAAPDAPYAQDFDAAAPLMALLGTNPTPFVARAEADEQLRLGMELARVETEVAHFETNGPAWSSWMRGVGYVFVPIGLLTAPYLSGGNSVVSSFIPQNYRSSPQVSGPLGTVHTAGWAVLGTSIAVLSIGVIAGVTGWVLKKLELGEMEEHLAVLQHEWELKGPPPAGVIASRQ